MGGVEQINKENELLKTLEALEDELDETARRFAKINTKGHKETRVGLIQEKANITWKAWTLGDIAAYYWC